MNIAVMTDNPGMSGMISETFSVAAYLQIIDNESGKIITSYIRDKLTDSDLANKIVENDCEAVICGPIEQDAFVIIADEGCVTRYDGRGLRAGVALNRMNEYALTMITDFIGGEGCGSGTGECNHEHENEE